MVSQLALLNDEEQTLMLNVPALVTILVAGSDKVISDKELDWAEKTISFRSRKEGSVLQDYYYEVSKFIDDSIKDFLTKLPEDVSKRTLEIGEILYKVNSIWPKLDQDFAKALYNSFLTYAEQVAQASGGILGSSAVSPEEKELMKLSMINPPGVK
jgi:hypothetical protein